MDFFTLTKTSALNYLQVNENKGLSTVQVKNNANKYGQNLLTKKKKMGIYISLMMLLLMFQKLLIIIVGSKLKR